jgi:hypothetical protein
MVSSFGQGGDIPFWGDWDGSGKVRIGVFRPSTAQWFLDINGNGVYDPAGGDKVGTFGVAGDIPVVGDWTGSGVTRVGIFRSGLWELDSNGDLAFDSGDASGYFGVSGDQPIVGKWTAGGPTKIGIFRPSTNLWSQDTNGDVTWEPSDLSGVFGQSGDMPILGDWNGDGRTKIGIYRPSGAMFSLDMNANLTWDGSDRYGFYGNSGETPVVGDWLGTGVTQIGVFYQGSWALDSNGDMTWEMSDLHGAFGQAGDTPIVGPWSFSSTPLTLSSSLKGINYFPRGHAWDRMLYDWNSMDCSTTTAPHCVSGAYVSQVVYSDLQKLSQPPYNVNFIHLYLWDQDILQDTHSMGIACPPLVGPVVPDRASYRGRTATRALRRTINGML